MQSMRLVIRLRAPALERAYAKKSSNETPDKARKPAGPTKTDAVNTANVTGFTSYVYKQQAGPIGPGASTTGEYKVPEYFSYDRFSYHGAEVELAKYRCPQPSAVESKWGGHCIEGRRRKQVCGEWTTCVEGKLTPLGSSMSSDKYSNKVQQFWNKWKLYAFYSSNYVERLDVFQVCANISQKTLERVKRHCGQLTLLLRNSDGAKNQQNQV